MKPNRETIDQCSEFSNEAHGSGATVIWKLNSEYLPSGYSLPKRFLVMGFPLGGKMSNQLFENAVKACKSAMSLSNETEALSKHLETLQGETVSAVEIACAESYAWFISVNRKHGSKQD